MKLRVHVSLILVFAVSLFIQACNRPLNPQDSCNFVMNPDQQRVSWKMRLPVKLYLHSSVPREAFAAIDRAITEYNLKLGNGRELIRIVARGVDGALAPKKDGYSIIYWFNTWDPKRPTEQARTTIYWSGTEIFEADMRINAANFSYYFGENSNFSDLDLQSLMVHELGHVLGLAHNVSSGSVMNFTLDEGVDRRKLGTEDLSNLRCEY